MKKTLLLLISGFLSFAAVPAGYEHWTAEQFAAREKALHIAMKDGLASETIGNWGNHILLKIRRESSTGRAEVHENQSDLILVQSGRATIIIGGKIINGQRSAPNEIRGTSIEGGERQPLKAGDVVHVPPGTPHQVIETSEVCDFLVLKVDSK